MSDTVVGWLTKSLSIEWSSSPNGTSVSPTVVAVVGLSAAATAIVTYITVTMFATRTSRRAATYENKYLENQSKLLPGPERIRVSHYAADHKRPDTEPMAWYYDDAKTLYESFHRGLTKSGDGPCYGWRNAEGGPYQWISYSKFLKRAQNFGSGLVSKGFNPGSDTHIGIYSVNRLEWVITEQACYTYSMVVVPLYDTLGADACRFIIKKTELSIVICDDIGKAKSLLTDPALTDTLRHVILIGNAKDAPLEEQGKLFHFSEIEKLGEDNQHKPQPPVPSDVATVCYTSGTTGDPKGVTLTHGNVVSAAAGVIYTLLPIARHKDEVAVSYLPLAHMLERIVQTVTYTNGGRIGFFRGDIKLLMDDIKELRPSVFATVPRLLNRIYDKVWQGANSNIIKKSLLKLAVKRKEAALAQGIISGRSIWDRVVFSKVQQSLGGNVSLVVSGSAPLSPTVLQFMRCAFGCPVVEGYGQTECGAPCTLTLVGDNGPGHVGPPLPSTLIKLVDVPDMNYYAAADKGEVCLKGANVFAGYYKDVKKTEETLDADGWCHTGDIGEWLPNGTLKIIDRKKHIFKLSQGEYVAPEKIESVYVKSSFVDQVFVYGDSLKSCCIAVVVPDPVSVQKWVDQRNDINGVPFPDLCANKELKVAIFDEMTNTGKKYGLKNFEQVKDIYVHSDAFSTANGLLTPTFKSKRPALCTHFKQQLHDMYAKIS